MIDRFQLEKIDDNYYFFSYLEDIVIGTIPFRKKTGYGIGIRIKDDSFIVTGIVSITNDNINEEIRRIGDKIETFSIDELSYFLISFQGMDKFMI